LQHWEECKVFYVNSDGIGSYRPVCFRGIKYISALPRMTCISHGGWFKILYFPFSIIIVNSVVMVF
jgi:hypothetical protein